MDVRAWLQNTADREPPDEEDRQGLPDYLRPERYTTEEHIQTHQGKRKHASSEPHSPLRHPPPRRHGGHDRAAASETSSDHNRGAHSDTASTGSSSSGERRRPSPDRRFNKTFKRRARHKTKVDRYEPKAKKRRKEHDSRKDGKTKSKRRKSHRSGDGALTAGLVTSFQLKDKPKNSRLTLRPADVSAGIFKHGRAGAPITGRGSGLPDLVFNEMRFLRRPREHQDERPVDSPPKEQGDKADIRPEGNISAYFAKPNVGEHRSNEQHRPVPGLGENPKHISQRLQQEVNDTRRVAGHGAGAAEEPTANAFLGFGSRGPNPEVSNANRKSNSFYTWSESVPAVRSPVRHTRPRTTQKPLVATAQSQASRQAEPAMIPNGSAGELIERPKATESSGRWMKSKRVPGRASVEVYQPDAPHQVSHHAAGLRSRNPSSLSLPRSVLDPALPPGHGISPRPIYGSCPTSDILRIRDESQLNGDQPSSHRRNDLSDHFGGKENQNSSTSTPTSKLLRHAFRAVTGPQELDSRHAYHNQQYPSENRKQHPHQAQPSEDTVCHAFAEDGRQLRHRVEQQTFGMPERGFSRSTDASHVRQRQTAARPPARAIGLALTAADLSRPAYQHTIGHQAEPDDEMLDNLPAYRSYQPRQQYTFTNSRQAEELMRRLDCNARDELHKPTIPGAGYLNTLSEGPGNFSAPIEGFGEAGQLLTGSEAQHVSTEPSYVQTWSNHDAPHNAPDTGGGRAQHDAMYGFWRPNKLY